MEYYQYFGLRRAPFQPASPDSAVYFSPTHLEGLATLESGLSGELSGLTMLTGEAGTGKTTLIYSLLQRDYKRVRIAHIDDPKLSFPEIMQVILTQLNLYSSGSTKLDYLNALDHLLELHGKEERIAIVVDEAQLLSDDVLEELRLLSNRSQRDDRCLQLILVGQPELAERLKKPELRQLNQRISSRAVLKPLNTEQCVKYVECKLSAQGGKCSAIFERRALARLLRRSDGIPRKINMLCHSAMLAAFYAGERKVSFSNAKKTAAEYHDSVGITKRGFGKWRPVMPALIAGTALAWLLVLGFVYRPFSLGDAIEHTLRPVATVKQAGAEGHPDAGAKPKGGASLAPQLVGLGASPAPRAAAPATPKNGLAGPATAGTMPMGSTAPVAAAASAEIQKRAAVPAAPEHQGQITVQYGDTLEKIAVRYFGSRSGINELIEANPQLTDINRLFVGQVIYLPPGVTLKPSDDHGASGRPVANAADSSER